MGTDTNINLQSEKQTTKPNRKSIPFTDLSIKNWRPKKDRDRLCFARSNITKGILLITLWSPATKI